MSETKHTPGPWDKASSGRHMRDDYHQPYAIYEGGHANLVAGVFGDVRGGAETASANARLIAAAPDYAAATDALYEALQRAIGNFTLAVKGLPVRDMAETLAEASAAVELADAARVKAGR